MAKKNSKRGGGQAVIDVVSVKSKSEVIPCFPSSYSPATVDLLTDTGCMCVSGPQRFVSPSQGAVACQPLKE